MLVSNFCVCTSFLLFTSGPATTGTRRHGNEGGRPCIVLSGENVDSVTANPLSGIDSLLWELFSCQDQNGGNLGHRGSLQHWRNGEQTIAEGARYS